MSKKVIAIFTAFLFVGFICAGVITKSQNNLSTRKYNPGDVIMEISAEYDSIYDNANVEQLEDRSELIIVGTIESIDGAINYNEALQTYTMISTIGKIKVDEIIKNDNSISQNDVINFIRAGGTISVAQYEKSLAPRQIVRQGLDKLTQDEKKNTFVKMSYEDDIEIEVGKKYLMYLNYDKSMKCYRIIGMQYGLLEYNDATNQVKNNETQSWETMKYNI